MSNSGDAALQLQRKMKVWQYCLIGIGVSLVCAYAVYFGVFLNQRLDLNSDKWGAFGDFFGGILNPLVAFAAFYWVTQSVALQRMALIDAKEAARSAAEAATMAQQTMLENGRTSVRLAALTALVNVAQADSAVAREIQEAILRDRPSDDDHRGIQHEYDNDHRQTLETLHLRNRKGHEDAKKYAEQIMEILEGNK
ncbi:hypothetical protein [Delftia sp. 60]|uniref:hypothetical protein n=1 Tax=Delftia sp. 60 TaxID=2035216 RepID=UPI00117757FD|nr:hypothetical protein [Delftia sp. 60]